MTRPARRALSDRILLLLPYAWLLVFFLAPFAIVAKLSLSQAALAQPPYEPAFAWADGWAATWDKLDQLTLAPFGQLSDDNLYLAAYVSSLKLAGVATVLTLLVAYPMAYGIAHVRPRLRPALVLLAVAPFWTSFLIRVYAWITILKDEGLLNTALRSLGLIDEPLHIFATDWAVLIGIVYSYLPFMVLPIYNAIARQDPALLEAAADLGAGPMARFWRVTFPLSRPGVLAGCLLVFIPAIGEFVIPDLLGGSDTLMIGRTIWTEFFENRDWPVASAAAVLLLLVLLVPMALYERARHWEHGA